MSTDRNANSSETDIDRARAAAKRLASGTPGPSVLPAEKGFVAFSAERFRYRHTPTPVAVAPVQAVPSPPARTGQGSDWIQFLQWCRKVTNARYAFLINGQGLLVASEGPLDSSVAEVIGSRLVLALEQADQMGETSGARSVAIDLGEGVLWGARVATEGDETVSVGLFAAAAPAAAIQKQIQTALHPT